MVEKSQKNWAFQSRRKSLRKMASPRNFSVFLPTSKLQTPKPKNPKNLDLGAPKALMFLDLRGQ